MMKQMVGPNRRLLALGLLLFATQPFLGQRKIEERPVTGVGQGIQWRATLTRFQKRDEGSPPAWSTPAWKVQIKITNYTKTRVELGGFLTVIEPAEGREEYASVYIALHALKADPRLKMVEERYGLMWGVQVEGTIALWPIGRVVDGMSANDRFALLFRSPGEYNFEGGGFGYLSPRSEREITEEVLFPIGVKTGRSQVVLIAPSQRLTNGSVRQQIFSFDVGKEPQPDQVFKPTKSTEVTCTVAALTPLVESESEPRWKRIFALNWLTETDLKAAEPLLLRFATSEKETEQIRVASVANLGAWKVKTAVGPLVNLLSTAGGTLKASIVQALGEIGEASAIPAVRPLLKDLKLKPYAVEAIGKLKDSESVPFLLAEVRKGTDEDSIPASESLAILATEPAIDGLIAIVSDKSADRFARIRAFVALSAIGNPKSLAPAAAVLADNKQEDVLHSLAVDTLVALMKGGSAEARTLLTKYAEAQSGSARYKARQALGLP